ncbi:unnamed protein product [Tuber aestivum]|uniref:Endosomal/vacuolar adapter protein YPT35 n=1 Tax=Tuber aestivum TaxID=59557 RepID=A0A292PJM6_9PEZI|nr:unnamed protein product [Tuber aestivum]
MDRGKLRSGRSRIRSAEDRPHKEGDEVLKPMPITLIDHTITPSENSPSLWARSAKVVDYVIVAGSRTRAGAYVAWNCSIETFGVCFLRLIQVRFWDSHCLVIMGRELNSQFAKGTVQYSEFVTLRDVLRETFPRSLASLPALPPKSVVSKFRPKFLEARRQGLSYFLSCILLNPEFAGSPPVKDFLLNADD